MRAELGALEFLADGFEFGEAFLGPILGGVGAGEEEEEGDDGERMHSVV